MTLRPVSTPARTSTLVSVRNPTNFPRQLPALSAASILPRTTFSHYVRCFASRSAERFGDSDADVSKQQEDDIYNFRIVEAVIARRQIASLVPLPVISSVGMQTNSLGVDTVILPTTDQPSLLVSPAPVPGIVSSRLQSLTSAPGASRLVSLSRAAATNPISIPATTSPPLSASSALSSAPASTSSNALTDNASSGPSAGLIAGAVIGSVAVLVLIGIFVLLYWRHKRTANKESSTETPQQVAVSGKSHYNDNVAAVEPELATNANAWELQGSGTQGYGNGHGGPGPWELPGHVPTDQTASKPR